jgi:hypothetical protein
MAYVNKLLKDRPQHLALTLKLGHIYRELAKYSLALVQYNKALRLHESGDTYAHLARAYDKLNKRDSAVKSWENALRARPDTYVSHYRRALEELVAQGDLETAQASVDGLLEAVKLAPEVVAELRDSLAPHKLPRTEVPAEEDTSQLPLADMVTPVEVAAPEPAVEDNPPAQPKEETPAVEVEVVELQDVEDVELEVTELEDPLTMAVVVTPEQLLEEEKAEPGPEPPEREDPPSPAVGVTRDLVLEEEKPVANGAEHPPAEWVLVSVTPEDWIPGVAQ